MRKPPRSALPRPRYVEHRPLASGWHYYFKPPSWARAAGCPIDAEPLGVDYDAAVERAERVLLPAFDAWLGRWRGRAEVTQEPALTGPAKPGTLDWLFAEYRASRQFTKLPTRSRRHREANMLLVADFTLTDGRRLGVVRLAAIRADVADAVFEKLLIVRETSADGTVIERKRPTRLIMVMKHVRRAWFVVARSHPDKVPFVNPFAKMGLESSERETPAATYAELQTFRKTAREMGMASLGTAALIAWEWCQRVKNVFASFSVEHYRPRENPNAVFVVHSKTNESFWMDLFDEGARPIFPELMAELDEIRRSRIGGLMIVRDWGDRRPWPTWPAKDNPDLTYVNTKVREIIRAAGLRAELTFTSFRHGGMTEMGDADMSNTQIRAQSRHRSDRVLSRYIKKTTRQIAEGAKKRRAIREATTGEE
jgi:hypothetical protein